jgi:tetraacyldisaccharide 4'-kinase
MRAPAFWQYKKGPMAAPLVRTLLMPFSFLVTVVGRLKQRYQNPVRASVPVICIGNVTLGGTGKTPLAIALAKILQDAGQQPFFLSRGYGGKAAGPLQVNINEHSAREVGDEALLLAAIAPAIIARDRAAGARLAVDQGASVILMDDGFQNPSLAKDVSLLVVDTDQGMGNGRVFPAGPLREPLKDALKRADAVIAVGQKGLTKSMPVPVPVMGAQLCNLEPLPKGPLIAFAGIGRPDKFFDALRKQGAELVQEIAYDDHQVYQPRELERLKQWAAQENATLLTTQKDYVRLTKAQREGIVFWPLEARFDDTDALMALIHPVLSA